MVILPKVRCSLSLCLKSPRKREKRGRIFEEDLPFFCFTSRRKSNAKEEEREKKFFEF
jgi:hypothetical protein